METGRVRGRAVVTSLDVQVLQTAASLDNLTVSSCAAIAAMPFIASADPALRRFISRTGRQHEAHAAAFNQAVARLGGRVQHAPDPRYANSVRRALTGLADAVSAVTLLSSLEDVKAQTYTRYGSIASAPELRMLFVSVAAVEAQHRAFLQVAQQLLSSGAGALLGEPAGSGAELPTGLWPSCLPGAFYPVADASAIDEGSVK